MILLKIIFLKMPVPVSRVYIYQSFSPPQATWLSKSGLLARPMAAICLLGLWGIGIPAAQASLANPDANLYTNIESRYQSTSFEQFFATIQSGADSNLTPASNTDFASIASAALPGVGGTNSSDDKGRKLLGGAMIASGIVVALFVGAVIVAANRNANCCTHETPPPPPPPPPPTPPTPPKCPVDCTPPPETPPETPPTPAPAPLPLLGVGLSLAWSRKFRNRMTKVPRQLA